MQTVLMAGKALSDQARVRALLALRDGELCLCQIIDALGLAPSTVSRHMDVLFQAGLVRRRKDGKWHYFQLAGREASPTARGALRWVLTALASEPAMKASGKRCCPQGKKREEAAACYRS